MRHGVDSLKAALQARNIRYEEVANLQAAINAYLAEHNANPKPFVWTKTAEVILAKLDRLPVSSVCV